MSVQSLHAKPLIVVVWLVMASSRRRLVRVAPEKVTWRNPNAAPISAPSPSKTREIPHGQAAAPRNLQPAGNRGRLPPAGLGGRRRGALRVDHARPDGRHHRKPGSGHGRRRGRGRRGRRRGVLRVKPLRLPSSTPYFATVIPGTTPGMMVVKIRTKWQLWAFWACRDLSMVGRES